MFSIIFSLLLVDQMQFIFVSREKLALSILIKALKLLIIFLTFMLKMHFISNIITSSFL